MIIYKRRKHYKWQFGIIKNNMPEESGPEKDMSKESLGVPKIEWNQVQKAVTEAERKSAGREGRPVPEIAGGAPGWLVENVQELSQVPNQRLNERLLRYDKIPDSFLTPQRLEDMYFDILGEVNAGGLREDIAAPFLSRITSRTEAVGGASGQSGRENSITPEIPKTKDDWLKLVRAQVMEMMDESITPDAGKKWVQTLKIRQPRTISLEDALDRIPQEIANQKIAYEYGGKRKEKKFKEILQGEVQAMEKLHKRMGAWLTAGPTADGFEKVLSETKDNTLDPGVIESISTLLPNPGEKETIGDRVDKALKAYRKIAAGNFRIGNRNIPNVFTTRMSDAEVDEVREAIRKWVVDSSEPEATRKDGDKYAEEIAFRLMRCWGEASWGDSKLSSFGARSDGTVQLMWFEAWRNKQATGYDTRRLAGPSRTLRNCYPKRLMVPFLRLTKTDQQKPGETGTKYPRYLSELIDSDNWKLRDIDMHRIAEQVNPDLWFLLKVQQATKLFLRLTSLSLKDITPQHFQEFNRAVDDGIFDEAVQIEENSRADSKYWSEHKDELGRAKRSWRERTRRNYLRGIIEMSVEGGEGDQHLDPDKQSIIVESARKAGTISGWQAFWL